MKPYSLTALGRHWTSDFRKRLKGLRSLLLNGPLIVWQRLFWQLKPKPDGEIWLYSLDFHPAVTADLEFELKRHNVKILRNVISFHNRHFRRFFRLPDPVPGINEGNWRRFSHEDKNHFQKHHRRLFSRFDGFIVSYPTSFIDLYLSFGKPILVVNPIRYEHPFSNRPSEWQELDNKLKLGISSGQLDFISNNSADSEYAFHYLQTPIKVLPSVCRYTRACWNQTINIGLTYAHYTRIAEEVEARTNRRWRPLRSEVGRVFSWRTLMKYQEIFYVPYAPSTMFLFELATAGMPVAVPSLRYLKELRIENPGVFGQLTFHEMTNQPPPKNRAWIANGYDDVDEYIEWWYLRSDFVDLELMPNVRIVESLEELVSEPSVPGRIGLNMYRQKILQRNRLLIDRWDSGLAHFLDKL